MQGDIAVNSRTEQVAAVDAVDDARLPRLGWVLELVQLAALAWVVWLPVSLGRVLYPALILVFVSSAGLLVLRRRRPSRSTLRAWGIYYAWAVAWTGVSYTWDNPGVWHQAALWLGLPLLWGTWALSLHGRQVRRTLLTLLTVGSVSAAITLWLAAHGVWGWPELPAWLVKLQDTRVNVSSQTGETAFNWLGLSSFVGIGAVAVAGAILPVKEHWLPRRSLRIIAAALILASAGASGRNGLLLALLVVGAATAAFGVLILVLRDGRPRVGGYLAALAGGVVLVTGFALTPLGVNVGLLASEIVSVVAPGDDEGSTGETPPSTDPGRDAPPTTGPDRDPINEVESRSDQIRRDMFPELTHAGLEQPLWGQGFGATLDSGFYRSEDRPWMFEVEPLQAFMNVGFLGLLALCFPLLVLARGIGRAVRESTHLGAVVAGLAVFGSIVLASATNPYLQAPGHGWMLFLVGGIAHAAVGSSRAVGASQDADRLPA